MALICYHNLNPLSPKALDLILLISAPRGTTSKAAGDQEKWSPPGTKRHGDTGIFVLRLGLKFRSSTTAQRKHQGYKVELYPHF